MTGTDETLIQNIRQVLDANPPDAETRGALQRARARALTPEQKRTWRMPWLEFAVTASLIAVLAINLPGRPASVKTPQPSPIAATGKSVPATTTATSTATKAAPAPAAADADLLENLELYEDAEFYQWLSEQDAEGAQDA